ncbi:MAG: hypothetical protein ISR87_03115 [Candidatus Marinimicrobia bacterium]|jgi:hypothetical protein|nr:hypothetical protein [FCB group bacterium]MBL7024419.1 hypothetical protein [Candidatus Neomarinimicrobiota bacterium]
MKSFRGEKQKESASVQIIITVLALLTTILLANFMRGDTKGNSSQIKKTTWESSVIQLP